jgi:hypothetical protein
MLWLQNPIKKATIRDKKKIIYARMRSQENYWDNNFMRKFSVEWLWNYYYGYEIVWLILPAENIVRML